MRKMTVGECKSPLRLISFLHWEMPRRIPLFTPQPSIQRWPPGEGTNTIVGASMTSFVTNPMAKAAGVPSHREPVAGKNLYAWFIGHVLKSDI